MDLKGTSALVFGGASGMGAATAVLLEARGAHVVVADLRPPRDRAPREVDFVPTDITSDTDVIAATDAALDRGPLRAVVVTAALGGGGLVIGKGREYATAHSMAWFNQILQVDLAGTFNCVRITASAISRQDPYDEDGARGALVLTASRVGISGDVGQSAYAAAKSGLFGLTRTLAREFGHRGIRVNLIAPGGFDTPIFETIPDPERYKADESAATSFPKRLGRPEEYATMALELLTNGYANGALITLDGGAAR